MHKINLLSVLSKLFLIDVKMPTMIFVAACCSSFRTLVLIATITTLGNIFFQLEISSLTYLVRIPVETLKKSMRMMYAASEGMRTEVKTRLAGTRLHTRKRGRARALRLVSTRARVGEGRGR